MRGVPDTVPLPVQVQTEEVHTSAQLKHKSCLAGKLVNLYLEFHLLPVKDVGEPREHHRHT